MLRTCAIDFSDWKWSAVHVKLRILVQICTSTLLRTELQWIIWNPTPTVYFIHLWYHRCQVYGREWSYGGALGHQNWWMFGILSPSPPLKKHTSGSRKTGIVCEVPRSNRKHRRTQLVLVVSCNLFLLHFPDGFITSTLFYNEKNVFPHFHGSFHGAINFFVLKLIFKAWILRWQVSGVNLFGLHKA